MRAVRCHELVGPKGLKVDDVPDPTPGHGEVLIDVEAAGVNVPDILITEGKYQFKPPPPFIPGGEVGGIVRAIGPGVTLFAPGDRVAAFMVFGAFAERVVALEGATVKVPAGVDLDVAASMVITYGTMMHALVDRGALRAGETLLALGAAGGIGTASIELGKCLGARVIAAASSQEKLAYCKVIGADAGIDTSKENLKERAKSLAPAGVDVVSDPVGGEQSEAAMRAIGWGGRHLVIGFASGTIPKIATNLTLLKACQIVGVFYGMFCGREPAQNRKHLERVFGFMLEGKIKPHIDRRFSFDEGRGGARRRRPPRGTRQARPRTLNLDSPDVRLPSRSCDGAGPRRARRPSAHRARAHAVVLAPGNVACSPSSAPISNLKKEIHRRVGGQVGKSRAKPVRSLQQAARALSKREVGNGRADPAEA